MYRSKLWLHAATIVILFCGVISAAQASRPLPSNATLQSLINEAHAEFKELKTGKNADYIPILTTVPSELFGIAIVTREGNVITVGDVDYRFSIQSVSKPFNAALVMQESGAQTLQEKIGVEPTGLPFNSKMALELYPARSVNPLVNAGAIASVSMVKAKNEKQRWKKVLGNLSDFAGEPLTLMKEVYKSEYESSWSNRGIANLLYNYERLYADPEESLRVYTKMCSVGVTARQLAMMGGTLANDGINPKTNKRVLDQENVPKLLSLMMTAGFYDESGRWSYTAGLPAKTGVGGGIVAVVPGQMAIVAFSPRVNEAGNSVRSLKAINFISERLSLSIFNGVK